MIREATQEFNGRGEAVGDPAHGPWRVSSADIFAKDVGAEGADRFLLSFQFQIDSQGFSQDF